MVQNERELLGDVDLVIIGGGPAGSSTAMHILKYDPALAARSILLEKTNHPREKICGGALTLNAERVIEDLGINLDIPSAPVHHVQLVYGNARIDLAEDGCAKRVIRRCDFDGMLFKAAKDRGFPTMEDTRVRRILRRADHLLVVTDRGNLRAQAVVGCDGVGAVVRKTTGFTPGRMGRLWVAEIPVDPKSSRVFQEQVLIIDLSYVKEGLRGYYWEFPCFIEGRPFISAGIVDTDHKNQRRVGCADFLTNILARRGIDTRDAMRKAFPIRHFSPRERFARPRMLLAGDALGSDPLFSEGISQALEFGRLAAKAVVEGFARKNLSFSNYTKTILQSRVGKELAAYARFSNYFYGPRAELFLSLLYENVELRRLIGCSYAGTQNMHQKTLRMIKLIGSHLLHVNQHLRNFRSAANLTSTPAPEEVLTP